jgi:hypothetical protein
MTVRLNVMLVQSPGMSGLQSEINTELAIQLMGVPGIDVAILNSLRAELAPETDRLLLSATHNDLVIIDWREPSEVLHDLAQLGITGTRAPHRLDPDAAAVTAGVRRLYLIDLRRGDRPAAIVDALRALLNDRRVVTVSLAVPATTRQLSAASSRIAPERGSGNNIPPLSAVHDAPPTDRSKSSPPSGSSESPLPNSCPQGRPSESDLEALVDGVNASDW